SGFLNGMAANAALAVLFFALLAGFGLVKEKIARLFIALMVFGFALFENFLDLQWFAWLVLLFMASWLLFKLYFLSKKLLRKKISLENLEEGMIPAETLLEKNGKIEKAREFEIKKIINHLIHNNMEELLQAMKPEGRIVVSSARAAGLEIEDIKKLRELAEEKKIGNTLEIRESVPFVPAILIGYVILNIVGDLIWNILFAL
ncbi:MAG: A24 family peptidase C-terminal domain-containing protein, partial [Candidatus ainarchaeum sp.]|nr:A24 family peptidase C-terminal domain-containing protein [Candidatus ainarchaeum sp.]